MTETQTDYQLLAVFVAVAQEASFTKAARKLGIGKGTVSRAVSQLEDQLGAELVHRTTHAVALSTAGAALYERTAPHLTALDQAVKKLPERAAEPSGVLRITAPHDFCLTVLPELLGRFTRRYPDVRVDVRSTNSRLDLVAEGIDVAIRPVPNKIKDSALIIRRLRNLSGAWYAAPTYLARRGKPKELWDPAHDWILMSSLRNIMKIPAEVPWRFTTDDMLLCRNLAREGGGICFLPSFTALPLVKEGLLEEVLPRRPDAMQGSLAIVYPSSGQVPRKVTAFCELVIEWAKTIT